MAVVISIISKQSLQTAFGKLGVNEKWLYNS